MINILIILLIIYFVGVYVANLLIFILTSAARSSNNYELKFIFYSWYFVAVIHLLTIQYNKERKEENEK
jgi:hypothetical protein